MENVALLKMVRGDVEEPWPQLSRWCTLPKFVLVVAGSCYAAASVLVRLTARNETGRS